MRSILILLLSIFFFSANSQSNLIEGKWDLTVSAEGKEKPSWLSVSHSGVNTYVGQFVYAFGSARPISEVKMDGNKFSFSIPRQWEPEGQDMQFTGTVNQNSISGTLIYTDGTKQPFTGVRAPKLAYTYNPTWGEPINLFNGKDFTGWTPMGENQWKVIDGVLTSEKAGANLVSNQKFDDFKLHIEFRYPKGSNSGIYLRGRYETQIADNAGSDPSNILFGGIYGFLTPTEMVAKAAGEWQSFDITLIGNRVTIIANGKPIIIDRAIPGITGGALDSNEGEAGPFMIQGDHGPVEFRNIIVTPRI
ncbi:3-keto-disaccharide hydrolase [Portibacter lacus]|uniref:Large multifunctional protein- glycosyl hydrolase n=1 Tax=Portibacter lacus TaxID=1099794 RepID=A0AA37WD24_9BACT|nr:DUF1080 domain-containing protein [Portibacter lacus]GLR17486.1 large multifunctional protein- glycosyl hydrolase [Portibacter lacus]